MDRGQRDRPIPLVARPRPWLACISGGGLEAAEGAAAGEARERLRAAARAGVDLVQIREKRLSGRELYAFAVGVRDALAGTGALVVVNERWDVALAAGMDGVHLPAAGLPAAAVRRQSPPGFHLGLSCHTAAEVAAAEGCDYCLLGPVFPTPSKPGWTPVGLAALAEAAGSGPPVLALGGVGVENASQCLAAGAAGVAGIRLFAEDAAAVVARLRRRS